METYVCSTVCQIFGMTILAASGARWVNQSSRSGDDIVNEAVDSEGSGRMRVRVIYLM